MNNILPLLTPLPNLIYLNTWLLPSKAIKQNINKLDRQMGPLFGLYRVIHKSFRDFRPLRYSSQDGHPKGEHVNRGRDTPSFCPTLQVLDMSTLCDAADVNPVIKFLPHTYDRNLECLSLCWHAPLRCDHPCYCTAEFGNPGGTYELPCIL